MYLGVLVWVEYRCEVEHLENSLHLFCVRHCNPVQVCLYHALLLIGSYFFASAVLFSRIINHTDIYYEKYRLSSFFAP